MARSDLLITLVRAGVAGDRKLLERAVEALVAEERGKQHHVLADRLEGFLQQNGQESFQSGSSVLQETIAGAEPENVLVLEIYGSVPFSADGSMFTILSTTATAISPHIDDMQAAWPPL
jgi:hypothetical protein